MKAFAILIVFLAAFSLVSALQDSTALAAGETGTTDGFTWEIDSGDSLIITDCSITTGAITIPSTLDLSPYGLSSAKPVIGIAWNIFNGTNITGVTIPDSVQWIGPSAFANCPLLTTATLGSGLSSIASSLFMNSPLTSVNIPNSVTTIGDSAFKGCDLTSVTIPGSVTSIEASAFEDCTLLQTLNLGSATALESIGIKAFYNCGLSSLTIPDNVTSIGQLAFADNLSLSTLSLGSGLRSLSGGAFAYTGFPATLR